MYHYVWDDECRGGCVHEEQSGYLGTLFFLLNFSMTLKLKNKIYYLKRKDEVDLHGWIRKNDSNLLPMKKRQSV